MTALTTLLIFAPQYHPYVCCHTGEFHLRLRQLEKSLLQALNDAKGKILDDDSVIATLETLKKEADDIGHKVRTILEPMHRSKSVCIIFSLLINLFLSLSNYFL